MAVIFLFIDGVGLGDESKSNPFMRDNYEAFSRMSGGLPFSRNASQVQLGNHLFRAVDANLGVEGLPQSGTGQTALFTGKNAAKLIGKHYGPFPHSGIKHLLREQSLFNQLQRLGRSMSFINAYPDIFFQRALRRNRWSCTTVMVKSAGLPLHRASDVKSERAVTAGLTQQAWREVLHIDVPLITPETAAGRILALAGKVDLVLSEYYLTDKVGHAQDYRRAEEVLAIYDRFLEALLEGKDRDDTLVLCSDHGNVEDLSTKTHTRNRVPLFVYGPGVGAFHKAESITDVTPGIVEVLR